MKIELILDDELVREIDRRLGVEGRNAFIEKAIRERVEHDRRWELIESAFGSISDTGHVWDPDPAAWVHESRHANERDID